MKYGFMSNYEYTIFFKQEQNTSGVWELHHSDAIRFDTVPGLVVASVRQCFFFLGQLASTNPMALNTTLADQWVSTWHTRYVSRGLAMLGRQEGEKLIYEDFQKVSGKVVTQL